MYVCRTLHTKENPSSTPDGKNEQISREKHFKQCLNVEYCWILVPSNVYVIYIFAELLISPLPIMSLRRTKEKRNLKQADYNEEMFINVHQWAHLEELCIDPVHYATSNCYVL